MQLTWQDSKLRQFYQLTKPRVVALIVFCAVIGMLLAVPGLPSPSVMLAATVGIWLVAGSAAAINCLVEQGIDALMSRTRGRPLPKGEVSSIQTLSFAGVVGGAGLHVALRLLSGGRAGRGVGAKAAQDHVEERPVHRLAHDVRQDGTRRPHQ